MAVTLIIGAALAGGWLFRCRGGGPPRWLPRQAARLLYAAILTGPAWWLASWWAALATVVLTFAAVTRGHGDWQDLGRMPADRDEWLNPVVRLFVRDDISWSHDAVGMALSGMTYTAPLAVAVGWLYDPVAGALVAIAGLGKVIAYIAGWALREALGPNAGPRHLKMGTEIAEALTGVIQVGAVWAVLFVRV